MNARRISTSCRRMETFRTEGVNIFGPRHNIHSKIAIVLASSKGCTEAALLQSRKRDAYAGDRINVVEVQN